MNRSVLASAKEVFIRCECIKGYTFTRVQVWGNRALLAKLNHQLAALLSVLRDPCAHLAVHDYFECLSPRLLTA